MKWALLLPKVWLLCISIFQAKSQKKGFQQDDQSCIFILWCHRPALYSRCVFFFCLSFYMLYCFRMVGVKVPSLTTRFSLCRCQDSFTLYEKKLQRNMIAPVKRANYSPLTTFKAHFYWPIQPNKTLLHERKGALPFLHSFSKPSIYMIPVITPL